MNPNHRVTASFEVPTLFPNPNPTCVQPLINCQKKRKQTPSTLTQVVTDTGVPGQTLAPMARVPFSPGGMSSTPQSGPSSLPIPH